VRLPERPTGIDGAWELAASRLICALPRRAKALQIADEVLERRESLETLDEKTFSQAIADIRDVFRRGRVSPVDYAQGLALAVEAGRRSLGMTAYREQVAGAVVISKGWLAEMATGEGKTLTAALAACPIAWRGRGCHVVTVNDYLAQRDADGARPLFAACGLTVAAIQEGMEPPQRREAYHASVTYATHKDLAADYLRDCLAARGAASRTAKLVRSLAGVGGTSDGAVMRGLYFAVVDEADSVMIDEAVTPLILAAESDDQARHDAFHHACKIAQRLTAGVHYRVQHEHRDVSFTPRGAALVLQLTDGLEGLWKIERIRNEFVKQAVVAREHYVLGRDYVVEEEKIVIVDASTGRRMADRSWQQGLHQAVEVKESLEITPVKETMARVSFQRFFRLYEKLAGLTGTAWEVRHELWRTYRTPVVRIPRHRPLRRRMEPFRVLENLDAKHAAVVEAAWESHRRGQPVLIGTASVDESQCIAALLEAKGVNAKVLNAVNHQAEAEVVAQAGQPGAVTVATNMAGRGTDIKLGEGVEPLGGLHVIAALRNGSIREDRQLIGRCSRQGEAGSAGYLASWDDDLVKRYLPRRLRGVCKKLGPRWVSWVFVWMQARSERAMRRQRVGVLKYDDHLNQSLGFARDVS